MTTVTLNVEGMTCGKCVARVDEALREVEGVRDVHVTLEPGAAQLTLDAAPDDAQLARLIEAVEDAGYDATPSEASTGRATSEARRSEGQMRSQLSSITLRVSGMTCASCVARVERALSGLDGVGSARVNYATETAYVEPASGVVWDEALGARLREAVEGAGYGVEAIVGPAKEQAPASRPERASERRSGEAGAWLRRFWVGFWLTWPIMALQMGPHMMGWSLPHEAHVGSQWVTAYLTALVMLYAGRPFFVAAWGAARHGSATMDTLVALGAGVAFVASLGLLIAQSAGVIGHLGHENIYFDGAAMILGLISLGKWMEASARGRASAALEALLDVAAKRAWAERGGVWVEVDVADIARGDVLRVLPGEKIPTDGEVIDGEGDIDEAMVTGESAPVRRVAGDEVLGGTLNVDGRLIVRATRVGEESALAQIMAELERAQASRASIQRLADRVSSVFVPVIMLIALVTFVAWWLYAGSLLAGLLPAVAVLVVACPCALGLATPTALMVGSGRGAAEGILIREADALERASRLDVVMFDKTGTLTTGRMAVERVMGVGDQDDLLRVAAALETGGVHPIAAAIIERAERSNLAPMSAQALRTVAGQGVEGRVGGELWRVGRPGWVHRGELPGEVVEALDSGATVVGVARGDEVRGWIAARDEVKDEAGEVIRALTARGVEVWMVTGDARGPALRVAEKLGLDASRVVAEVRPGDKAAEVERLRAAGRVVAFVGDGINDSPALAAADLGVALGTGADVALEAAQIALVSSSLWQVVGALELATATYRKIRQNLGWAFGYNVVLVPVAALGLLTPAMAAGAMALSSVSVVGNALLLSRWRASHQRRG